MGKEEGFRYCLVIGKKEGGKRDRDCGMGFETEV
jgi:hypothetical protein